MHVDFNSCFASIEQQANPLLRGKPTVVAAYTTGRGCILAASVEAKRLGIKTGMRVSDGRNIYPHLAVLPPDTEKYRWVSRRLRDLLSSYTPYLSVESIDEMVMDLAETPALERFSLSLRVRSDGEAISQNIFRDCRVASLLAMTEKKETAMIFIAREIKKRIRDEIGEWLTVSIGIAPNRYLAKVASGLHKPDGLDVITKETIESIFQTIQLEDLCGIKEGNATRLRLAGIGTPVSLFYASPEHLIRALHSKTGWDWWLRLHGYEDPASFAKGFGGPKQKTYGQSFALGVFRVPGDGQITKIMTQLIVKMGRRLRGAGFVAHGVSVSLLFTDYSHWVKNVRTRESLFDDRDFLTQAKDLLSRAPAKPVRIVAVTSFNLTSRGMGQIGLWNTDERKWRLTDAIDTIASRWGDFAVTPATMLGMEQKVLDRIAFGRVGGI